MSGKSCVCARARARVRVRVRVRVCVCQLPNVDLSSLTLRK